MDKIFVPEGVPLNYNYAVINNNYIDFYRGNVFQNVTETYYRVWYNHQPGLYEQKTRTFGSYSPTTLDTTVLDTTHSVWYRKDMPNILTSALVISLFFIFITNVITSIVRKGGILGGLL